MVRRHFAVEHAQWIHDHPALAVGVELLAMLLEERAQRRQVPITAVGSPMTHAVQQQRNRPDVRLPKQVVTDLDHFGVERRILRADRFDAQLVMLPEPTFLRPFVPEHSGVVVELDRKPVVPQVMRHDRAHHGGRSLGP